MVPQDSSAQDEQSAAEGAVRNRSARLAGINVAFDSQLTRSRTRNSNAGHRDQHADLWSRRSIILAMLDAHVSGSRYPLNTIYGAEDNVTKRRDYEDEVVKVFCVTNVTLGPGVSGDRDDHPHGG